MTCDRWLHGLIPAMVVLLPWGFAYSPGAMCVGGMLLGVFAYARAWWRVEPREANGAKLRGGLLAVALFWGLQVVSLVNTGEIAAGDQTPGAASVIRPLSDWFPGTVAPAESLRWLGWWIATLGCLGWMAAVRGTFSTRVRAGWLLALFAGSMATLFLGLAGKAGMLLPGFTDHHGVLQPFAYRNHGVAYAALGIAAGGALAAIWWRTHRGWAMLVTCVAGGMLVALPWSQARFSVVPQAVALLAAGFVVFRAWWRRREVRRMSWRAGPVLAVAGCGLLLGLGWAWKNFDATGRMTDTYRQIRLVAEGAYPDLRLPAAGTALEAGWARFPWGWGAGSFESVLPLHAGPAFYAERYQTETKNFGKLIPTLAAHNDLAEWWMEFGLVGLALLAVVAWGLWPRREFKGPRPGVSNESVLLAGGVVALGAFAMFDYPLHHPPTFFAAGVFGSLLLLARSAPGEAGSPSV